jgi:hypothetical protein
VGVNQFGWFPELLVSCTNEAEFNKAYFSPINVREFAMLLVRTQNFGNTLSPFCSISKKEGMVTTEPLKGKVA